MSRRRSALVGAAVAGVLSFALLTPGSGTAVAQTADSAPVRASAPAKDGFRTTKSVDRTFVDDAQGTPVTRGSYDLTVSADHTTDLRGRERVKVSWTGAPPSGGRASNPFGENGMWQEYPVVVMQCRGTDNPSLPAAQRLRPETCWTSTYGQRSQIAESPNNALWTVDRYATAADKKQLSGVDKLPADACKNAVQDGLLTHLTPFVTAAGKTYYACDASSMPPEAAVGAAFPPSEIAAFSDGDGNGSVDFEVRSSTENESLGCKRGVACSIVVIPIAGLSCGAPADGTLGPLDRACRKFGAFASGTSNFARDGVDAAVAPSLWWAPSNWRNRVSIPISFGLPPGACDVLDPRAPVGFSGSELMAQAALQWAPAYCLNKKRFKFQLNQMPDQTGWNLMQTGESPAAFVSAPHEATGPDPVGYAPTAVTGFSIGYVVDRPDNAGEATNLRLNARLIAKLLSQSYPGSSLGTGHEGLAENPWSIQADPEFIKLNPGLSRRATEAGATLLSLSNSSDIIGQLTEYLAQDADARAFLAGKADPWGMKVNPSYKGISIPTAEWPLLDTFEPKTQEPCRIANPGVYLSQIAAPVTTLRKVADALIDSWPNVQTRCEGDLTSPSGWKVGRVERQSYGARFLLGIVSLGDADRYGLRSAALRTSGDSYVAPSPASLAKAIGVARQKKGDKLGPFAMSQKTLVAAKGAYPGTQVVYTVARTHGMDKTDAKTVGAFIRIATSEGQRIGRGNGELPEGYLPLRKTGATAALWRAAQDAATAIEAQKAAGTKGPGGGSDKAPDPSSGSPGDTPPAADPGKGGPAAPPSPAADEVVTAQTEAASSTTALSMLPALLVIGLVAAIASLVTRLGATWRRRG
ncbi:hypothetical protein F9L07_20610 [Pimelobacter simplex]|uniref:Uncharacterized protein n=1 Tax=Nocardioides simplex TaxID=2045 RepID=A0A7J5DVY9_NOCSI|nr:hypothetical protein [Pimelobacter simplex]KAB2809432.1 hypothetical protein F9L07_20610 [Pimelobacter simplex]